MIIPSCSFLEHVHAGTDLFLACGRMWIIDRCFCCKYKRPVNVSHRKFPPVALAAFTGSHKH